MLALCSLDSHVTHPYLKDRTTEKREKKETVLQSNSGLETLDLCPWKTLNFSPKNCTNP